MPGSIKSWVSTLEKKDTMRFRCICSDLDRTILRKDGTLSPKTKKVLSALMEKGMVFVPATGRSFYSLPEDICTLPGVQYVIVSNGAAIYDIRKQVPVYQRTLKSDVIPDLFHLLKGDSFAYEGFVEGVPYTSFDYYHFPEKYGGAPGVEIYIQKTRKPVEDIRSFLMEHRERLDAVDVIVPPERRNKIMDFLREKLKEVYITSSVPHLIEISDKRSGKHHGICEIARLLKITPEQIVAFGDGDNDSEMLKTAGMGAAVSNGSDLCKKSADRVIGHHEEDGVADFLAKMFLDDVFLT